MSDQSVDTPESGSDQQPSVDPGLEPQGASDPFAEQFQSMEDRLMSRLDERLPAAEEPQQTDSLADYLMYEPDGQEANEIDEILADDDAYYDDGGVDLAAFDELVSERVQEGVRQAMEPIEQAQLEQELNALQETYPDITEPQVIEHIEKNLGGLVERHQNQALATDPVMVELAYKAAKAELASADEVPAESAATREATLETGAGPSQQGNADPDDEYRKGLLGVASGGDVFS